MLFNLNKLSDLFSLTRSQKCIHINTPTFLGKSEQLNLIFLKKEALLFPAYPSKASFASFVHTDTSRSDNHLRLNTMKLHTMKSKETQYSSL